MTKNNLIEQIAERMQSSKKDAEQVLEAVLDSISDAIEKGEKVDLRGFGNFQVSSKKERQGRNPKTGEAITIAAKKVAVFKAGRELTDRVNGAKAADEGTGTEIPMAEPSEESAKLHGDKLDV